MKYFLAFQFIILQLFFCQLAFAGNQWVEVEPAFRKVTVTGFTRADSKMPLISEVSGKVSEIFADVGEPIPHTNKFACLDDTFVDIDIKSANSEVKRNQADINYFKKEVERHKKLVKKQTAAVSILDKLIRDLGKARQDFSIASLKKQRLEELMRRHCIKAPAGWLLIDRNIEIGQWINKGEVLAQAGNYLQLIVPVTLSHHELDSLKKVKDGVEVLFPDLNVKTTANIKHISPAFDEKTRKILVELLVEEIPEGIRGGMRAGISLNLPDQKSSSSIISKQALEERFEEYWLERKDGKRIRVKLLSDQIAGSKARVSSSQIKLGDQFKVVNQ